MRQILLAMQAALLLGAIGATALHCDNGAVGVEACRAIENKRCALAAGCPNVSIKTEQEVLACQMFYRDQCLFGVAEAASEPDQIAVEACLGALDRAAACKGADSIAACDDNPPELAGGINANAVAACDVIVFPERLSECGFLGKPEGVGGDPGTGGAPGGMGGAPGGMGGAPGGMGGAPGGMGGN